MVTKKQRKHRRRRQKTKKHGGFIGPHDGTDLDRILEVIPEYSDANSLIYISVGSKYTEDTLTGMTATEMPTNSIFQMIPYFLYNNRSNPAKYNNEGVFTENKVLNIIIDDFSPNETEAGSLHNNLRKIEDAKRIWVDNEETNTDNINMFIINLHNMFTEITTTIDFQKQNQAKANVIKTIIEKITERVAAHSINPKNYMVCNYVKFKNPNKIEENAFQLTIDTIHTALSAHGYAQSEYNWFGYKPAFYHFIYQGIPPTALPNAGSQEALYTKDNKEMSKPQNSEINRFLRNNADKMFIIINPEIYDMVKKKQNNFIYSLKELRDVVFR